MGRPRKNKHNLCSWKTTTSLDLAASLHGVHPRVLRELAEATAELYQLWEVLENGGECNVGPSR